MKKPLKPNRCICSVGMMVFNKLAVLHFSAASRGLNRKYGVIFGVALVDAVSFEQKHVYTYCTHGCSQFFIDI